MFELNLRRAVLKDRYEIKGRISSGSYAEVFVARDRESGDAVVIKALNTHLQGTPPPELEELLAEKFDSEAAILNQIRHPNIVSILDQGDGRTGQGESLVSSRSNSWLAAICWSTTAHCRNRSLVKSLSNSFFRVSSELILSTKP